MIPLNQSRHPSSPRSSGESPQPRIHRKPLPNVTGQAVPGTTPSGPAAPPGKENHGHGAPQKHPMGTVPGDLYEYQPAALTTGGHRMPLSPRSPPIDRAGQNVPTLRNVPRPHFHEPPHVEEQPPPPLPTRPGNSHFPSVPTKLSHPTPDPPANAHALSSTKRRLFSPFSLTLIRRDPSSGQQWNVGKIASFQLEDLDLTDDEKHHQASPSIQIHLETSGYAKFRGMPAGSEVGLRGSLDLRPGSSSSTARHFPHVPTVIPASGAFERQVKMTYSPSFTAGLRRHFRTRNSVDEGRPNSPVKCPGHVREGSEASIGSFGGDFDGSDAPVITQPAPGLKSRGYMFYSPWNGRCEFVTGTAGRTLKCRHILPSYGGGVYNPLVEGPYPEHGDERVDSTRPISELRFNLPSNELLADKNLRRGV